MKKIILLCTALVLALTSSAQLAWDTEFTKNDYENAQTVISKTENVSWISSSIGLDAGIGIGKLIILGDAYNDECVVALSQTGIAENLKFAWHGGSGGTVSVYQSPDHNSWSTIFSEAGNADVTAKAVELPLATNTRYLKFAATGKVRATFRAISVTELKALSANTDEWPFGSAMVDDADGVKNVTVSWTNIVTSVTSTDPHFTTSLTSIGQKNLIDQSTTFAIRYSHEEAGNHSGEIVIAGEGKEWRIAVSGETKKYDQTLTWIQDLTECVATDHIVLNAFTSSGLDVVYESSDNTIAYVENGEVQIVKAGQVTLTATQPGDRKFNAAQPIAKTLLIHKADPMIGVTVDDLTYGQKLSEAVIHETLGKVEGSFSWVGIDPESILDAGDYPLTVLFTPDNEGIYKTRTLPVALHINKAPQYITWEEQETNLKVGENVPSTAVLSSGLEITYAYTECLLSIEEGVIIPENEGAVTVIAFHPGNNNYLPTTVVMTAFVIEAGEQDPTAIRQLSPDQLRKAFKYLHNGKVYVSFDGRIYDAEGKMITK